MIALLVTFQMEGSINSLGPLLRSYSQSLDHCPGHIDHVWLRDEDDITLLHLFEDEESLQRYLASGLTATLKAHPACTGRAFTRRFQVLSDIEPHTPRFNRMAALQVSVPTDPGFDPVVLRTAGIRTIRRPAGTQGKAGVAHPGARPIRESD
jgi:hypothetical protein